MVRRLAAWLAGLWAGVLLGIGALAAPSAFATLTAADAGRLVNRLFAQEAYLSLAMAVVLLLLERRRQTAELGSSVPAFSIGVLLLLGALFCTVGGYFAVQPMMAAARAGQGTWSFGALHGVSAGLFVLKGLLVLVLAWWLALPGAPAGGLRTTAIS